MTVYTVQPNQDAQKVSPNWKQRVKFGLLMSSTFVLLIYLGPIYVGFTILFIQVACYREIVKIGYKINKITELPHFRLTSWYFLIVANYFLFGETLAEQLREARKVRCYVALIYDYHRFKSFCFYFLGIMMFVISLAGKYDVKRFRLLALTHVLLMLVVLQSYMLMRCLYEGLVWILVPVALVILNDIFAYIFGKLMGKTPLIQVSPKKTWEGFIGGVIFTVIAGFILSTLLCSWKYFVCPTEYDKMTNTIAINTKCIPSYLFHLKDYTVAHSMTVRIYPFVIHSFFFSLFASIIAPFGGFFASGFKRAFNIKDFSDTIPGHGGIMDRFDCQYLMAMFLNAYISSFIKSPSIHNIYKKIMYLPEDEQLNFYHLLGSSLQTRQLLEN